MSNYSATPVSGLRFYRISTVRPSTYSCFSVWVFVGHFRLLFSYGSIFSLLYPRLPVPSLRYPMTFLYPFVRRFRRIYFYTFLFFFRPLRIPLRGPMLETSLFLLPICPRRTFISCRYVSNFRARLLYLPIYGGAIPTIFYSTDRVALTLPLNDTTALFFITQLSVTTCYPTFYAPSSASRRSSLVPTKPIIYPSGLYPRLFPSTLSSLGRFLSCRLQVMIYTGMT